MSGGVSIGLLIGSESIPVWFAKALSRIETETDATLDRLVISESRTDSRSEKGVRFYLEDIKSKGCWTIVAVGRKVVGRLVGPTPELRRVPITSHTSLTSADIESCRPVQSSQYRYAFPPEIVESLAETDITLHWGVGILEGNILDAPTYGIWGTHHGDVRNYRGGPPGFWEYLNREDRVMVTLQRFTEELDGGEIIVERELDVSDALTLRTIRREQCRASIPVLVDGVRKFSEGPGSTYRPAELGPIYRPADRDCRTTGRYLARSIPGWTIELLDETT